MVVMSGVAGERRWRLVSPLWGLVALDVGYQGLPPLAMNFRPFGAGPEKKWRLGKVRRHLEKCSGLRGFGGWVGFCVWPRVLVGFLVWWVAAVWVLGWWVVGVRGEQV